MIRFTLGLCLLTVLCSFSVRADNPGTGPYGDTKPAANGDKCRPCYEIPNGCKGTLKASCIAYDKANPGYFSGLDSQCGLPAGTSLAFANEESSCITSAQNTSGFTGLFQFNSSSCKLGNLTSVAVQSQCFCNYTAQTRKDYAAATGGQTPSMGMYYLFHQQGGCGLKLALGGNRSAVDVVTACRRDHNASIAYNSIAKNLPVELKGMDPRTITAQLFAGTWMNKIGSAAAGAAPGATADSTKPAGNICAAGGNPADANTANAAADPASGNVSPAFTSLMNMGGGTFGQNLINSLMLASISQLMPDIPETNDDNSAQDDNTQHETVRVTTNPDGTVKVTVVTTTNDNSNTSTYTVNHGQQLWKCGGTYEVVGAGQEATLTAQNCHKIAESAALPVPVTPSATTGSSSGIQ